MTKIDEYIHSGTFKFKVVIGIIALVGAICTAWVLDDLWNKVSIWWYGIALTVTVGLCAFDMISIIFDMLYIKEGGSPILEPLVSKTAKRIVSKEGTNNEENKKR